MEYLLLIHNAADAAVPGEICDGVVPPCRSHPTGSATTLHKLPPTQTVLSKYRAAKPLAWLGARRQILGVDQRQDLVEAR